MAVWDYIKGLFRRSESVASMIGGGETDAGATVTYDNAPTVSAVWSALQILSDAVVGLPVQVRDDKRDSLPDHSIAKLLQNDGQASPYMSAVAFKAAMMFNVSMRGNAYARIERGDYNQPVALHFLANHRVSPVWSGTETRYVIDGGPSVAADNVMHLLGPLTSNGCEGLSPIQYARQTVGLSMALERFAAKFFGQGGNIGGIIETGAMKKDAAKNFLETWRETYTGPAAAFKIAALTGGMKFHPTTADPENSQATPSRVHQVLEVSRVFRVPPHMLGVMDKASYASIEMQNMEFYQNTIQPYVIRWESEIVRKLLSEPERAQVKVRLNMDAKLRGTTTERYEAYKTGREGGWLSVNDIRRKEDLPEVEGGDGLLQPLNMATVGSNGGAAVVPPTTEKNSNETK